MKLNFKSLAVVLCALACLFGCKPTSEPKANQNQIADRTPRKPVHVSLATSKNLWCGLSLIAKLKGFYEQEGLDVDVQYLQSGRYCLDALVSGSADFANIVEVNVAYFGFTGNTNVAVVGSVVSSTGSAIVARKSSGIAKPEDLRGKRLAFSPGTTSDVFAYRFLKKYGLGPNDLTLTKIQPLAMQSTMLGKGADAVSTWQPFVHAITQGLKDDAILFEAPDVYVGYETVAVRKDWAGRNKDTVKAFLRANRAAEAFVKNNPAAAQEALAKEINLDLETVRSIWSQHNFVLELNVEELGAAITKIGEQIRQLEEEFAAKALPEYKAFFDASYVGSLEAKANAPKNQ